MSLEQTLAQFSGEIDHELQTFIRTNAPYVADMAGYFLGWLDQHFQPVQAASKGKRLRPILTLLICDALSGSHRRALPLAAAIELIHNYSLIHDDIADRDEERRGRPTVWKIWGDGLAINTGSVLYTLAYQIITTLDAPPELILDIHKRMIRTSIRLSEGQHWDITYERSLMVTQEMYLTMIEGKTAALLEFATHGGALLGTDDRDVAENYRRFGLHLGLAFQIRDDYLSIWGDTHITGKPPFSDLRNKKKSLPITYAFSHLQGAELERVQSIYAHVDEAMTDEEIHEVLGLLEKINTPDYTRQLAEYHTNEALTWLNKGELDNDAQRHLQTLAHQLTGRTS